MQWVVFLIICGICAVPVLVGLHFLERLIFFFWDRKLDQFVADAKSKGNLETLLEDEKYGIISISSDGFTFQKDRKNPIQVKWNDIEKIEAYKADQLATDLICLAFQCSGFDFLIQLHEEMKGFDDLKKSIESRFDIDADWWGRTAFPPFDVNRSVIWSKEPCEDLTNSTSLG
jgi:hypothetical protein